MSLYTGDYYHAIAEIQKYESQDFKLGGSQNTKFAGVCSMVNNLKNTLPVSWVG
jgi:hypothetical protein